MPDFTSLTYLSWKSNDRARQGWTKKLLLQTYRYGHLRVTNFDTTSHRKQSNLTPKSRKWLERHNKDPMKWKESFALQSCGPIKEMNRRGYPLREIPLQALRVYRELPRAKWLCRLQPSWLQPTDHHRTQPLLYPFNQTNIGFTLKRQKIIRHLLIQLLK